MIEHSFFDFVPWWALLVTAAPILLAFLPIIRFFASSKKSDSPPAQHVLFLKRVQTLLATHHPELTASFGATYSKVDIWNKAGRKQCTLKLGRDKPQNLEFPPNTQSSVLTKCLLDTLSSKPSVKRLF